MAHPRQLRRGVAESVQKERIPHKLIESIGGLSSPASHGKQGNICDIMLQSPALMNPLVVAWAVPRMGVGFFE